ncbi:MAG: hypothetical protein WCI45_03090 [Desulfuromonadales bacterium]
MIVFYACFIALFLSISQYSYALDSILINEKTSLFSAIDKSLPIITSSYIGWAKNWKWTDSQVHSVYQRGSLRSSFTGRVAGLGIDFAGTVNKNAHPNQFYWKYRWDKQQSITDAVGFGIEFKFLRSYPGFPSMAKPPELLSGNSGWRWQTHDGRLVTVQFSPALARIYFEKQQQDTIRALFFTAIERGKLQTVMTVTVDESVKLSGPVSLDYDDIDLTKWHADVLPGDTSVVDLSFLDKRDLPAGNHGFVKAHGAELIFADGTPARFWGANLQAHTLFSTSDENIRKHARRIAQLGFNLVRIHHHDSKWVKPNIFKNPEDNTMELSPESLRKLDLWMNCLKEQGVYLWLDLHVGRTFTKNDKIDNFDDLAKGKFSSEAKGFNYLNVSIQRKMQAFNSAYLSHVNAFTGIAYKDDPAVIALLLTNENDLSQHFGNALLGNKGVPLHNKLLAADAQIFSKAHNLSYDKTMRSWEMGESKIFLNDVEHRFNRNMIDPLKKMGVKSLIVTTSSWGGMGLSGLPSLSDGDVIDAHSYGTAEDISRNPRYYNGFLAWIGAAQVADKPLSVTEWNIEPFPAADRFTAPLFTASVASLQGWNALMLYGYSQVPLNGAVAGSNYSSFNDPAIMGLMPAAALLYRQNHVAPARNNFELQPDRTSFFFTRQDPSTSKTIRTLLETSRFSVRIPGTPELPWLRGATAPDGKISVVHDMNRDFIPAGRSFVESDTGELKRDWEKGIHTIDTSRSQIASGAIGGKTIRLNNVVFSIRTKKAVVAIQSLDERDIKKSGNIFITLMARSQPDPADKSRFLSEPVVGIVTFTAPKGLKLYPVSRSGNLEKPIGMKYVDGRYTVNFSSTAWHWYFMK